MIVKHFEKENEWLDFRKGKISGTLSAAIVGLSPYTSTTQAYELLVGESEWKDISSKDCVIKGKKAEDHIRALFALDHPEYEVQGNSINGWDVVVSEKYNFIMATPDGFLKNLLTGKKGVLEIKTCAMINTYQKEKWSKDKIPENYYCQVLQEMYCTDADFGVLVAELMYDNNLTMRRVYIFNREDVQQDIDFLIEQEIEFYNKHVIPKVRPALTINL